MHTIEVLGAHGSLGANEDCVSFKIGKNILIDAGNVLHALGDQVNEIEHVFISHAHFDHIRDLPFMIESYFLQREKVLNIYASETTINAIKVHLFNGIIWPPFHEIPHPELKQPLLALNVIGSNKNININELTVKPFQTNHCDGSLGFIIEQDKQSCIICSDTYLSDELSQVINHTENATSLFIETSFPNQMHTLAETSKHLTPALLEQQLSEIKHPIEVFLYHLKPATQQQVKHEILELFQQDRNYHFGGFLESGQRIQVFDQAPQIHETGLSTENLSSSELASILKISQALSGNYQIEQLLEMVIDEAMLFSQADAGTLYRFDKETQALNFTVIRNNELNIKLGGSESKLDWPALPLYIDNLPNAQMVAAVCALTKQPMLIDNVYHNEEFDFSGARDFDKKTGYHSQSMLVVPLLAKDNELLGVMQLINKKDSNQQTIAFSQADQESTMALASQAALSISNAILVNEMEALFEAFASSINVAFDKKCFFTGKHINQVAELAEIISHAINEDDGLYANINYSSEMLHTIKIAALVHDVGKIATPESVLHKATKLHTMFDLIELVKVRFQLYKQTLQTQPDSNNPEQIHQIQQIDKDLEFLINMNSGREFLADEDAARIEQIANIEFEFDGQTYPLLTEHEKANLLIRRGTLTDEERLLIQDHAALSLEMLQNLPFPEKYGKIVDIAANHHEKLNGQGYPRGLNAEQLTLEDEILALADIYEALSSAHRPYKKPMTLAQVVDILCNMANHGEIDGNLVRFFFEAGIYKRFNHRLNPGQITDFELSLKSDQFMSIYPKSIQ